MGRKIFQFFIFSKNRRPLYIDDNGQIAEGNENYLKPNGQPANLVTAPGGWKDSLIKYARNIKYWGTVKEMTVAMNHPRDGKAILHWLFSISGVETIAYYGIMKLQQYTLPYMYENWFLSEIDFSKSEEDDLFFKVQALEGGLSKLFKAYETTVFEIEVKDEDKQTVFFDGIPLHMLQQYSYLGENGRFGGPDNLLGDAQTIPIFKKEPDGLAPYVNLNDVFQENATGSDGQPPNIYGYMIQSSNCVADIPLDAPGNVLVRAEGRMSIIMVEKRDNNSPIRIRFYQVHKDDVVGPTPKLDFNRAKNVFYGAVLQFAPRMKSFEPGGLTTYDVPFDFTFDMAPGDKLFYMLEYYPSYADKKSLYEYSEASTLNISYKSKYQGTYADGYYAYQVVEKLIDKIIGENYILPFAGSRLKSNWLYSKTDLIIMSGNNLRRIPGATIKTSIAEAFQSLFHYSCGLAVNTEQITIELMADFFRQNVVMLQLGEVSEAKRVNADDLFFNTFKVGGADIEYEDVNGKFEPNQIQEWKLPITRYTSEKDLTTPWRRDPYGIEFTRINKDGAVTTDDASDNDTFMISVEPTVQPPTDTTPAHHKLLRYLGMTIEGVPDQDGMFNVDLSPKRTILNNAAYLASLCDLQDASFITFSSAVKNKEMKTTYLGQVVDEDAPLQVGIMPKHFKPYYFIFTTKVPLNLTDILGNEPYGLISFTVKGREFFGYLFDGGVKPGDNDKQSWKLLCAPQSDISKWYVPL